jgi:hypothetical protein
MFEGEPVGGSLSKWHCIGIPNDRAATIHNQMWQSTLAHVLATTLEVVRLDGLALVRMTRVDTPYNVVVINREHRFNIFIQ